jgi:hypothetical protein
MFLFSGVASLHATLVCVACSQLETLRAAILDIRQTHVTSEQDCGAETDQLEGEGQVRACKKLFGHMQKQLNECIRHHQQIIRCVYNEITKSKLILLFRIRETRMFLHKIKYFHIHGRTGNCNKSSTVWAISAPYQLRVLPHSPPSQ